MAEGAGPETKDPEGAVMAPDIGDGAGSEPPSLPGPPAFLPGESPPSVSLKAEKVVMSGKDIKRTTFREFPLWAQVGVLVVVALVAVVAAVIIVTPTKGTTTVGGFPKVRPQLSSPAGVSASPGTTPQPTGGGGGGAGAQAGGPSAVQGAAPVGSPGSATPTDADFSGPPNLRVATGSEVAAVTTDVRPPSGQRIDLLNMAPSDETWGIAHVTAGGGRPQIYLLVHELNGVWEAVDSGYPSLACYQGDPTSVRADLGSLSAPCLGGVLP